MSTFVDGKGGGPLTDLVLTTKEALDCIAPMVREFYLAINDETSKLKADKSVFTIADGIVQNLLVTSLFGGDKFKGIVGEEDVVVNITTQPYMVEDLAVPAVFCDLINSTREAVAALSSKIDASLYKDISVFIDPIDGTREFSTGLGEQCTILVGFANSEGRSVAGVVYRPIPAPGVWAAGCASEGCCVGSFERTDEAKKAKTDLSLVTTNGSISKFTEELIKAGLTQTKSGGAGNKSLMLLEGRASCYIQDRGVSRWDTCGPEAVLDAFGGILMKLNTVITTPDAFASADASEWGVQRYTYLEATSNLDFTPGEASLTAYNKADSIELKKGDKVVASEASQVKPYANLAGLFAIAAPEMKSPGAFIEAVKSAAALVPPSYD